MVVLENVANTKKIDLNQPFIKHKNYDLLSNEKRDLTEPSEFTESAKHLSSVLDQFNYISKQMNLLSSIYAKLEGRVKKIELHQRGCQVNKNL